MALTDLSWKLQGSHEYREQALAAFARAFAEIYDPGDFGYVWGAQGQFITDAELLRLEATYGPEGSGSPGYYHQDRTRQWIGKRAADCSGLIMYIQELAGMYDYDKNANTLMEQSRIVRDKLTHGDLAFRLDGGRAVHVGIYLCENKILHCRGTGYGLVVTDDYEYDWDTYGRYDRQPWFYPQEARDIVRAQLYG